MGEKIKIYSSHCIHIYIYISVRSTYRAYPCVSLPPHFKRQFIFLWPRQWTCFFHHAVRCRGVCSHSEMPLYNLRYFFCWCKWHIRGIAQQLPSLVVGVGKCSGCAAGCKPQLTACLCKRRRRTARCKFKADGNLCEMWNVQTVKHILALNFLQFHSRKHLRAVFQFLTADCWGGAGGSTAIMQVSVLMLLMTQAEIPWTRGWKGMLGTSETSFLGCCYCLHTFMPLYCWLYSYVVCEDHRKPAVCKWHGHTGHLH